MNFYTIDDPESPATGMADPDPMLSVEDVPIQMAGSLVSEGSTEMTADPLLFSVNSDSVFSEGPTDTAKLQLSEVPTGVGDPLSSGVHTRMSDSQSSPVRVYMYMFSVTHLDARRNPKVCVATNCRLLIPSLVPRPTHSEWVGPGYEAS